MTKSTITDERITSVIERLEHYACNLKWTNVRGAQDLLAAADGLRELQKRRKAAMDSEPVALKPELAKVIYHFRDWNEGFPVERFKADYVISWMLANYPPAQPAPLVPDGYVMVPKEPTEAMMLHNSGCQHHTWDDPDCAMRQTRRLIWSHMLAAAPQEVK
ncbi:Uncharacterised protein [Klebsiella pneumoniae]|uniref:hypothetical protein n=1 Tax=Klebsiella pneumoniae TaxID=573 RepID=UPI000E2B12AF|nr:hypothetical protein [Klebsiella pneumoniae]SXT92681.1 Uncharacterised protein [Klebsiella pneumoniae]